MLRLISQSFLILGLAAMLACSTGEKMPATQDPASQEMAARLAKYTSVKLTTDTSILTEKQRAMIPLLIEAAQAMDRIFWKEAFGDPSPALTAIGDPNARRFAEINYGPWDRLDGNRPFLEGTAPKPAGANFYPADMTREEFEQACSESPEAAAALKSLYTLVRRDGQGKLTAVPYHVAFKSDIELAAAKLKEAAGLAEEPGLKHYLELRAEALLTDNYQPSDLAWLDMKNNQIDMVIGPIETYEDQLFGAKAAHEAYVLVKDMDWSQRLSRYAALLPDLQRGLPVPDRYKQETPGSDSDLNAYDVIYYAGDCNAGSKTIAINLPNDEEVQLQKGTRRLQLKNAMRAKFDKILVPIANSLIVEDQREHITFDAFFQNVMFHEVAHGLGIKSTLTGKGTVREALQEQSSTFEEGKADVLGLYMVTQLLEQGELGEADIRDYYVTFIAGIFRSIRFGASSAHGRANLMRFNFFQEMGAFTREDSGLYRVNFDKMGDAVDALSAKIIQLQGDGDYAAAAEMMSQQGTISTVLESDLDKLGAAGIPTDVVFEQGLEVLGLQ